MAGNRPVVTLKMKHVNGGRDAEEIPLGAWWDKEGKLSGGWDAKIRRVLVEFDDGSNVTMARQNGRVTHWLNLKDWRNAPQRSGNGAPPPRDDEGERW